ncbi:hypothetical protein [Blastococcus sp. CT_GayMR16]|uniref:hypothetical protein n=1 Tax=Blastococcus sp. CT_GayMR16 TaxID=2559607 RepID=UPI0010745563|nr:hypothetical protein [Blastococcus sp. CT_GayMR16]TFV86426.1 hypothetical protein E4P38_16880 [Blastococcus sp. CT_GayMR16]
MSLGSRWRRVDAEHWVHRLGMLQTTLLVLLAGWTVLSGFVVGLVAAVVPAALAALAGWMTAAWRRDEPWSWPAWVCASGAGAVLSATQLVVGGPTWASCSGLALAVLTLVLLAHPDSRARWLSPSPPAVTRSGDDTRADAGEGRGRGS